MKYPYSTDPGTCLIPPPSLTSCTMWASYLILLQQSHHLLNDSTCVIVLLIKISQHVNALSAWHIVNAQHVIIIINLDSGTNYLTWSKLLHLLTSQLFPLENRTLVVSTCCLGFSSNKVK